jgi:hypothetical protein
MDGKRSIWWLPTIIAGLYALAVVVYGVIDVLFGGASRSWTALAEAVAGSALLVWLGVVVASLIVRAVRRR